MHQVRCYRADHRPLASGLSHEEEVPVFEVDRDKVNINGGAVSIGHPVGASGGRLITTLLNGLEESGGRYGLATLCIGGGEAVAAIIERL